MNVGKTLFAQIMEFVPWTSFATHRASLRRQRRRAHADVRRVVACDDIRATDLAREPARYRGESGERRGMFCITPCVPQLPTLFGPKSQ